MGNELEIYTGEEVQKQLSPEELGKLADLWTNETIKPQITETISQTHEAVDEILNEEKESKEIFKRDLLEHLNDCLNQGNLIIAKREGKVVGMMRIMEINEIGQNSYIPNGTPLVELGKALTIPEQRSKGIYGKLRNRAIAFVKQKYGDIPILTGTKNEKVKKQNRKDDWQEIGFEEYLKIHKQIWPSNNPKIVASHKQKVKEHLEKGWTSFLYQSKKPDKD